MTRDLMSVFHHLPLAISPVLACPAFWRPKMAAVRSREVTISAKNVMVMVSVNIPALAKMECAHACHHRGS